MTLAGALVAVGSVVALFAMAALVRAAGLRFGLSPESQRKLVHVGVGVHAMLLPLVLDRPAFAAFAVLALAALMILRSPWSRKGAGAAVHSVERRSWGDLLFLVAVVVLFVRAPGDPALYLLPIAVLTLSDAAAAVVGTEYGRRRFGDGDRVKSLEGSVAFFVVTWMVAMTILVAATEVPRVNTVLLATAVATFAALVEADSWKGLDNLFVPVGVHALLAFYGYADSLLLGVMTGVLVVLVGLAQLFARRLGMTAHAVRSNVVCLFLAAGMTSPRHAILPVAAFLAHVASRRDAADPHLDDLDFVAVVTLIGVFWLTVAGLAAHSATEFFLISFAGVFAGLGVLALPTRNFPVRLAVAAAVSLAAFLAHHGIMSFDGPDVRWAGRGVIAVTAALTIAASAFGGAWRPITPFRRGPLFTALVVAIPGIVYVLALAGSAPFWRSVP